MILDEINISKLNAFIEEKHNVQIVPQKNPFPF